MKRLTLAAVLTLAAGFVSAQSVDAEVRKVDAAQGKLTLKHGEIKNLDMPPMTMVFRVADKAMLDGLKAGDKIKVDVDKIDGQYTVTKLAR
ncbi:copper-binding protein [Rubrivivax albus]|uniref:Copper-binding protein n=1 Tax=Rubrivivax albus TaxID=2499835 RepID=A0A3S2U4U0_9BURK|nr:copper-binding protein [Rubrivivax albus]RVT53624.1 copper-binding protein [Rubrivivax albus]